MASEIRIIVPLKPPSVNHYWGRKAGKAGMFGGEYIKPEGVAWKAAVAVLLRGESLLEGLTEAEVARARYCVEVWVFLGRKARGDGDNMWKGILDSLTAAGAIHSDTGTACIDLYMHVREDRSSAGSTTIISLRRLDVGFAAVGAGTLPAPWPVFSNGKLLSV